MVKRILRYLKGTIITDHHILANSNLSLSAYSDSDWQATNRQDNQQLVFVLVLGLTSFIRVPRNKLLLSGEYRAMATGIAEVL